MTKQVIKIEVEQEKHRRSSRRGGQRGTYKGAKQRGGHREAYKETKQRDGHREAYKETKRRDGHREAYEEPKRRGGRKNNGGKKLGIEVAVLAAIVVFALVLWPVMTAKPEITVKGAQEVSVEWQEAYSDGGAAATLRRKDISGDIKTTGSVDTSKIGTYEIDYTVHYRKKDYTQKRTVHVVDTQAPDLVLKGDEEVTVSDIEKYKEAGFKAEDNYDGDLVENVESSMEKVDDTHYVVSYKVADSFGNEASVQRKITVDKNAKADSGGNPKNAVYLTFDDGPSSDVTVKILDILKKNNIKATFFICNYNDSKKEIIQRMIDEGHTIGIHGYSHDYEKIYTSTDAFMDNIHKLQNKLEKDTGYKAFCIRFPGGSSNTVSRKYCSGIMTKLTKMVEGEGLAYYDWNVSSSDAAGNNRPVSTLVSAVKKGLKKNRSNVVLMHDTSAKQTTAEALQAIIDYIEANGYACYPISEDTIPIHHGVNN